MWPFTPRYLKHAKLLHKGVTRFLDYKRDLLPAAKVEEIEGLRAQVTTAIKARDRAKLDELHETINKACERALPDAQPSDIADNVEVFFVAIVIALGIRAYIAQPFQIPTGSMQPTLNGYNAEGSDEAAAPSLFKRVLDRFTGTTYVDVVSDHDGYLADGEYVTEHRWLLLFTYSLIHFRDGHTISVSAPKRQLEGELGLVSHLNAPTQVVTGPDGKERLTPDAHRETASSGSGIHVSKGQLLARGQLHSGDHILVNKFAYHFRTPTRGEVWVFTTKNIAGLKGYVKPEEGSQHYIKRLVGVPGDHLEVRPPQLWVNGKPAEEFGMQRVASLKAPYSNGYVRINRMDVPYPYNEVTLKADEYFAMGDNSTNSLDGRYWGPVPQRNVVGPALFCYFPFGGHWGRIW